MTAATETGRSERRRTEVELVADTLAVLFDRDYLRSAQRRDVLALFGLTADDLGAALDRLVARRRAPAPPAGREQSVSEDRPVQTGYVRPSRRGDEKSNVVPFPEPKPATAKKTAERPSERTLPNGDVERRCSGLGVEGHEPHWAPLSAFLERADRPGSYVSGCHAARREYQRVRDASVRAFRRVGSLGVRFEIDDDSTLVGIKCASCGTYLVGGDVVEVHGAARHARCATGMLDG